MNKVIISAVLACGLLLLDSPAAEAHESGRKHKQSQGQYRHADAYRHDSHRYGRYDGYRKEHRRGHRSGYYYRSHKMPHWLKRDKSFRHWYKRSRLRHDYRLSWHELFDFYRWNYAPPRYYRH